MCEPPRGTRWWLLPRQFSKDTKSLCCFSATQSWYLPWLKENFFTTGLKSQCGCRDPCKTSEMPEREGCQRSRSGQGSGQSSVTVPKAEETCAHLVTYSCVRGAPRGCLPGRRGTARSAPHSARQPRTKRGQRKEGNPLKPNKPKKHSP